jgi:delta-aminolevulinic acid dehydratase/porphobilinogen synthase
MVKPGSIYLDIVSEAKRIAPDHPVAVYHVRSTLASLSLACFLLACLPRS